MTDPQVEIVSISPQGLVLAVAGEQLCLLFSDFPWFAQATVSQICQVSQPAPGRLRWDALDVDLSLESIRAPEKFPFVSRVMPAAAQAHENAAGGLKRDARDLAGGATVIVQQPVGQLQQLDTVALLVEAQGSSFSGEPAPVLLSPGSIGVVVELLEGTVLVEFADLDGVAYATAFVNRGQLLRLHHGGPGAPRATGGDGVAPVASTSFQAERAAVIAALANAFPPSLSVSLEGEIQTPANQVLRPSLLVLRDGVPVVAVAVDDRDCSDFESVDLLEGCKRVDSLLYIILVSVRPKRALLFSRTSSGWGCTKLIGPAARIELPALDFQMALADVYARPAAATGCLEADPDAWLHTPEMEVARARSVWWSEGLNISYDELFIRARQAGRDAALEHARAGRSIAYLAANGELKHYDVGNPFPLLLEKLRADPVYAFGMFEEFWQLYLANDPSSRPLRQYFLKVLRLSKPDLSAVITDEVAREGWKRSQLARMIMDPGKAKQMSLRRLVGKLAAPQ